MLPKKPKRKTKAKPKVQPTITTVTLILKTNQLKQNFRYPWVFSVATVTYSKCFFFLTVTWLHSQTFSISLRSLLKARRKINVKINTGQVRCLGRAWNIENCTGSPLKDANWLFVPAPVPTSFPKSFISAPLRNPSALHLGLGDERPWDGGCTSACTRTKTCGAAFCDIYYELLLITTR